MLGMLVNSKDGGEEVPLESKMFSRFVENAQKRIEGNNFDNRKTVLQYDEVLRKQREVIYEQRRQVLFLDDIEPIILRMIESVARGTIANHLLDTRRDPLVNSKTLVQEMNGNMFPLDFVIEADFKDLTLNEAVEVFYQKCVNLLNDKKEKFPPEIYQEFLKVILLRVIDTHWMDHIDAMSELRQAVRLQAYAQINPLREYQDVGFEMFEALVTNIERDTVRFLNRSVRDTRT